MANSQSSPAKLVKLTVITAIYFREGNFWPKSSKHTSKEMALQKNKLQGLSVGKGSITNHAKHQHSLCQGSWEDSWAH